MIKIDYSKQSIGIIYLATFPNGKYYVGQTFHTLEVRANEHKRSKGQRPINKAIKHFGFENVKWEIIDTAETREELNKKEQYWINFYRSSLSFSDANGYNITLGGDGVGQLTILNEDELRELGKDFNNGMTKKEIKEKYNIKHDYTLNAICAGRIWTEFTKIPKRDFKIWKRGTVLTPDQVDYILQKFKETGNTRLIADELSVHIERIIDVVKGHKWSEYTGIKDENFYNTYNRFCKYLTNKELKQIGKLKKEGIDYKEVSKKFSNVPKNLMRQIWKGIKFSQITGIERDNTKTLRINEETIKKIIELKNNNKTHKQIAEELSISTSTIYKILSGKTHSDITGIFSNKK